MIKRVLGRWLASFIAAAVMLQMLSCLFSLFAQQPIVWFADNWESWIVAAVFYLVARVLYGPTSKEG